MLARLLRRIFGRNAARTGTTNTFQLPPRRSATILELEDVLFHHNSAVILPVGPEGPSGADGTGPTLEQLQVSGLRVLAAVLRFLAGNPCKRLLVAGHTDTSGGAAYNLTLSEERALSAVHLLAGSKSSWVAIVRHRSRTEDYQAILTYVHQVSGWDCDPGGIDDSHGPKTTAAVKAFQERYNIEFSQSITEDGVVGDQTWGAIFDVYQHDMGALLGTTAAGLALFRKHLNFADPLRQVLPCGESVPLDQIGRDGYRSQANRRVEFIFFDRDEIAAEGVFPEAPTEQNRFVLYSDGLYERHYLTPEAIFEASTVSLKIEYVPGAALRTPLTLEDASGTSIGSPTDVMTKDWRVVFTDDHMLSDVAAAGDYIGLLGAGGENQSVPAFYTARGWNDTSTPVLPLKVTVTKGAGGAAEPIDAGAVTIGLQLLVEPTDTSGIQPATERTFIETTLRSLGHTEPGNAELNADNAPDSVDGIRPAGSFQTATDRFSTFDGVDQATATPVTDLRDRDCIAAVAVPESTVQGCKNVSEVFVLVHLPQQSGERYRLRFHILGQATDNVLTSEVLEIWRRMRIELVVNIGTALTNAILTNVKQAFEQFCIQLGDPENTTTLTQAEWRNITFAYFNGIGLAGAGNAAAYQYDTFLLPNIPMGNNASRHAKALSRQYRTRGLTKAGIAAPTGNVIVYGPPIHPSASTLGFYLGNSLSAFFRGATVASTFVHELGHGRFLRHSFTRNVPGNPTFNGRRIFATSSSRFWRDHHQGFGGGCTMGYTRDRTIFHFCALCQLTLRFWDKVALRPLVQAALDRGWGALTIVTNGYNAITSPINMNTGDTGRLRVVAGPDGTGVTNFYKDVTQHGVITWRTNPAGVVTINAANGRVTAVAAGTTSVTAVVGSTTSGAVQIRVT